MNDQEIMKALEVCGSDGPCNECPFDVLNEPGCYNKVQKAALDIIQRQQDTIEELKESKHWIIDRLTAEAWEYESFGYEGCKVIDLPDAINIVKGVQNE